MIGITIAENEKWPAWPWVASVKQGDDGRPQRILERAFATNAEAWQWAQKIANTWQEESSA